MTAMRLKRYPSPSGGIALGKVGVGATMLKQGKTARDYVQDGLVAMWDGIENAGWGVHDANATVWKDLSGNGYDMPISSSSVRDNGVRLNYGTNKNFGSTIPVNYEITLHAVLDRTETSGNFCIVGFGYGSARLFTGNATTYGARFGSSYATIPVGGVLNSISMIRSTDSTSTVVYNGSSMVGHLQSQSAGIVRSQLNMGAENAYGNYRNIFTARHISIYSRALTAEEIAANYAIDKERFNLP